MNPDINSQSNSGQQPNTYSPNPGQVYGQSNPSGAPPQQPHNYDPPNAKSKKIMMILAGLIGVFIIVAAIVFLSSNGEKTSNTPVEQTSSPQNLFKEPSAIELENLNNSVSDDITNLSTDSDFPSDKLSDDNLEL